MEKTIAYIKNNRGNLEAIKSKLIEFAVRANPTVLRNFFVRCAKLKLPATTLAYYAMQWLLESGRSDIVEAVFATAPEENSLYGIYSIGQSFVDFKNFDVESGARHLREGLYRCLKHDAKNIPDQDLLMRNAFLLEQINFPVEERLPKPKFDIVFDNRQDKSVRTWCVAFDRENYERFFDKFVESVYRNKECANIVVLFVNPEHEMIEAAAKLENIAVAVIHYGGKWLSEFSKLCTFLFARDVLDNVESQVVFVEPTALFTRESIDVLEQFGDTPIGICNTCEVCPTGMFEPCMAVSRCSDESFIFWGSMEDFILAGLVRKGPLVGLGEVGLLVATSRVKANGFEPVIINSTRSIKGNLSQVLNGGDVGKVSVDMETTNNYYKVESLTPDKRIIVVEEFDIGRTYRDIGRRRNIFHSWNLRENIEKLLFFLKDAKHISSETISEILNFSDRADVEGLDIFFKEINRTNFKTFRSVDISLYVMQNMVKHGRGDKICALFEATSKNHPEFGLYNIGQSFNDFMNWDLDNGVHNMREGLWHCLQNEMIGQTLTFIAQNVFLLENLKWTSGKRFSMPLYEIVYNNRSDESPYTCCLISDPKYFNRYWNIVINDFRTKCPDINVFLTLINPTDDIIRRAVGAYNGENISVATVSYTGDKMTEFCHLLYCAMFYEVLKITGKPAVTIETDAQFPDDIKNALDTITKYPLGYTDIKDPLPESRIEGSTVCGYPSDETFAFWDVAMDNMLEYFTMEGPLYCFNQLALYVAVCRGHKLGWRMTDIEEVLNGKQRYYFKGGEPLPLAEKMAARTNARYSFAGMTDDRRVKMVPRN